MKVTPQDLTHVKEDAVAIKLAMDGQFDARIAELKQLIAQNEEVAGRADTIKKAQKIKADAEAYAKFVQGEADQLEATAKEEIKELREWADSLQEREAVLQKGIEEHSDRVRNELESIRLQRDELASQRQDIEKQKVALKDEWNRLTVEKEEFYTRQKHFKERVASIGAV